VTLAYWFWHKHSLGTATAPFLQPEKGLFVWNKTCNLKKVAATHRIRPRIGI
jgi:hypothetical protein